MTKLPEEIQKLKNLWSIYAANNKLEEIPESLACHENLVELDFSNNKISTVPAFLQDLPQLKMIKVD